MCKQAICVFNILSNKPPTLALFYIDFNKAFPVIWMKISENNHQVKNFL